VDDRVRRLAELTGWHGRSYVTTPWDVVHERLGFELPVEYRELLEVFPPGIFRAPGGRPDLIVQPPYRVNGVPDHLDQFGAEVDELERWRREHPQDVPDGLVPWARSGREGLFWLPDWTVAVSNGGIWRIGDEPVVERFPCRAVDFLLGFVTGEIHSRVLDPGGIGRPGPVLPFLPEDEQVWLSYSNS
jgi:hypothetical protein